MVGCVPLTFPKNDDDQKWKIERRPQEEEAEPGDASTGASTCVHWEFQSHPPESVWQWVCSHYGCILMPRTHKQRLAHVRGVGLIVWISSSLGVHRLFPLFGRRLIWPGWFKLGRKMPWHCSAHPQFNFQWDSVGWWRSPWSVYKRLTSRLPGGVRMWKREGRWLLPFFSFFCLLSPVFFFSPAWNKKKTGTAKQQAAGRLCEWSQCKRQGKVYFKITWHFEANINGSLLINVCLMRKRAP